MVKFWTSWLSVYCDTNENNLRKKIICVVEYKYQQEGQDWNPETASEAERMEECYLPPFCCVFPMTGSAIFII